MAAQDGPIRWNIAKGPGKWDFFITALAEGKMVTFHLEEVGDSDNEVPVEVFITGAKVFPETICNHVERTNWTIELFCDQHCCLSEVIRRGSTRVHFKALYNPFSRKGTVTEIKGD